MAYNSVETVFEYDELGRLRKLQSSDGANISYFQDKENNFTATVKAQSGQ